MKNHNRRINVPLGVAFLGIGHSHAAGKLRAVRDCRDVELSNWQQKHSVGVLGRSTERRNLAPERMASDRAFVPG